MKKIYPKLNASLKADIVIIGGGLTGILSAYLLCELGKKVTVLEKNGIGSGATKDTTAFITQVIDTSYSDLIRMIGKDNARLVSDSHQDAIDLIEQIIKKENIPCDFKRCSHIIYANSLKEFNELSKEAQAMKNLGIDSLLNASVFYGFVNFGYLEIKNQAKFNASKFIAQLAEILAKRGVMIFENSKARQIASDGKTTTITSGRYTVTADYAIVATYQPFNKPLALYFKKGFYVSYVISATIPKNTIKEATYQDSGNPYHYFRIDPDKNNDIITIGGEDHRSVLKFNKKKIFYHLENYLKTILPNSPYKITEKWTGSILEPIDGLPSIGSIGKENVLYAMAFSGNGMTYSAISARIFADAIAGQKNNYATVYSAGRIPGIKSLFVKVKDFSEELAYDIRKNILE